MPLRVCDNLVFQDDNHIATAMSLALVPELEPVIPWVLEG